MTFSEYVNAVLTAIGAVAGTLAIFAGAYKTYTDARKTRGSKRETLESRVKKLEDSDLLKSTEIFTLRNQVYRLAGVLVREAQTIITWYETGRLPPQPDREIRVLKDVIHSLRVEEQREEEERKAQELADQEE